MFRKIIYKYVQKNNIQVCSEKKVAKKMLKLAFDVKCLPFHD